MNSGFNKIFAIVILVAMAFFCCAGDRTESNEPVDSEVAASSVSTEEGATKNPVASGQRSADQIEAELAREYYKDCVDNLKWALGIVIALVVGFVGYAIFKSKREYTEALADVKEALRDAREACKEARTASDKAREYEEKAQKSLVCVDEEVSKKLKEIEDKNKTLITNLVQEAEKQRDISRMEAERQRKISELLNKGLQAMQAKDFKSAVDCFSQLVEGFQVEIAPVYYGWGIALAELAKQREGFEAEKLLIQSFENFEKAVKIQPDYKTFNDCGNVLMDLAKLKEGIDAEEFIKQALGRYEKAVQVSPDGYEAYNNWGVALRELAKRKAGFEAETLLKQACEKYEKSIQIKPDNHKGYNNWGNVLSDLAREKEGIEAEVLLRHAFDQYEKSTQIKSDDHETYHNWGIVLSYLADQKEGVEAEEILRQAIMKYERSTQIEPKQHNAYNGWGVALCKLAEHAEGVESEALFKQAIEKYEKSLQIKTDKYEAYNNWSKTLLDLAKKEEGEERKSMLEEAKKKCLMAESIKTGSGAYNLACAYALLGEEAECRKWLEAGAHAGTLPACNHAMSDLDLESVRDTDWFKQIPWPDNIKKDCDSKLEMS